MCSIMGYCGSGAAFDDFKKGFDRTVSRGPDDSRVIDTGKGLLGFHRLSIMGLTPLGMQPFELDGSYVVCNGELYGFDKQKKELIEKGYLVKYNYYPIYVDASYEDENKFDHYTKLMSSCFRNNICIDVESLAKYKRARLRVISMADEKINKIEWILSQVAEKDHLIVYCGDGKLFEGNVEDGIRHIQFVKDVLTDNGYKVSQFTASESMDKRMKIVEVFNKGMIDSMVAIRCLDEGINIPSIEGALLLSSNDDYREFVQRRGRILRTYYNKFTGKNKEIANIYDVIVLPSDYSKNFASIELRRFYEYARLAENKKECLEELNDLMIRYGLELEQLIDMEDTEDELDE